MADKLPSISVVFPAYNEEEGIAAAVSAFKELTRDSGESVFTEIIVVDNNSSDRTAELAAEAGARVISETRQGYGSALRRGLHDATGEIIVIVEPDGTFIAKDVFKLLAYSEDFEMVCGTRTTRELVYDEANMGQFLRWGNWAVAKMLEFMYGTCSLSDCGCTFRLIHRDAFQRLEKDLTVTASHFLPNMVIAARMNNVSFIEIPVSYRGRVGESKITGSVKGMLTTGFSMIGVILAMWPDFLSRKNNPTN